MRGLESAQRVLAGEPWTPTPLLRAQTLSARLGLELWLKREDCTPVGSFKLRGGLVTMACLGEKLPDAGVYVASVGNYGLAIAYAGQRRGVRVTVVVPEGATPSKVEKIRLCGAAVITHGSDFDSAKEHARALAYSKGGAFWEDGVIEEMALGAATIATELLEHSDPWNAVIVPIGNGSLMKGIASVIKERSPETRTIGLVPSSAPAMYHALRGESWDDSRRVTTTADGLAVRVPIKGIVEELKPLVDDLWLVDEARLLPAVRSLMELEQVMVEPSAAICVAGLAGRRGALAGKRVAAIMTGAHLRWSLMPTVLSAEGLL